MDHTARRSESNESLNSPVSSTSTPAVKRHCASSAALSGCCRTCRMRKVKCGGNPGDGQPCSNCARLELRCPFMDDAGAGAGNDKIARTTPTSSLTEAGTTRKRAQRACNQCHAQKTKCSGDLPRCKRCENGGLGCEYSAPKRKFANLQLEQRRVEGGGGSKRASPTAAAAAAAATKPTMASSTPSSTAYASPPPMENGMATVKSGNFPLLLDVSILTHEELLTRQHILLQHFEAYMENLYWLPGMGLFNPRATPKAIIDGTLDSPTATALCAVASFFVDPSEAGREFGRKCCDEVEFYLFRNIHKFSEEILLVCVLILSYDFIAGAFAKVWQCLGLAARGVVGLQLNWDFNSPSKSFEQQEVGRRIAWQVFVMDRLLAGGYDEYISCRADIMKIRLPCDENAFWEDRPVVAERLYEKTPKCRGIGIHGMLTRLVDLFHRVLVWNTKLLAKGNFEPSKIMEEINAFQSELAAFSASLPEDMRLSDQSIAKYMPSAERMGYVYLQVHLLVAHIELYRFALPGVIDPSKNDIVRKLPLDFVEICKKQAVAHALCTGRFFVAIVDEVKKHPSRGKLNLVGDCTTAQMSGHCLRVLFVAIEHGIMEKLDEQTTAPLWRFRHPDEAYIRVLIRDGFLNISEPWCEVLTMIKQVHATNVKMLADFDRTRSYAGDKATLGFSPQKPTDPIRLPGPHFILENANNSVAEQERRTRAADAATADRWYRDAPLQLPADDHPHQPHSHNHNHNLQQQQHHHHPHIPQDAAAYTESEVDSDFGPPGVPLSLAAARTFNIDTDVGGPNGFYDPQQQALALQQNLWMTDPLAAPSDSATAAEAAAAAAAQWIGNTSAVSTSAAAAAAAAAVTGVPVLHGLPATDVVFSHGSNHQHHQPGGSYMPELLGGQHHHHHQHHQHHQHQQQSMFMNGFATQYAASGGGVGDGEQQYAQDNTQPHMFG